MMLKLKRYRHYLILLTSASLSSCSSMADDVIAFERVTQLAQVKHGDKAVSVIKNWESALNRVLPKPEVRRLQEINDYFNMYLSFQADQTVWGVRDYWATPLEALLRGSADCEDYAIAKYFSLKYVGVDPSRLRMTYVRARTGVGATGLQAHMVLAYYATPDSDPLVLDNLMSEVRPASRRPDLLPVFSFNADGLWKGASASTPREKNELSLWQGVLSKMKQEGFE